MWKIVCMAMGPMAMDPMARDPMGPVAMDPVARGPMGPMAMDWTRDPMAMGPMAMDPMARGPMAHDHWRGLGSSHCQRRPAPAPVPWRGFPLCASDDG